VVIIDLCMLMSAVVYLPLQVTVILDCVSTAANAFRTTRIFAVVQTVFKDRVVSTVRIACRFLCQQNDVVYTAVCSKLFA